MHEIPGKNRQVAELMTHLIEWTKDNLAQFGIQAEDLGLRYACMGVAMTYSLLQSQARKDNISRLAGE